MTDRKTEGATGGRWAITEHGFLTCERCAVGKLDDDVAAEVVDLLNRGEARGPTEASLRALREARRQWRDAGPGPEEHRAAWAMVEACDAVLASSAAESHSVHVTLREGPKRSFRMQDDDAPEPGKAKAKACIYCGKSWDDCTCDGTHPEPGKAEAKAETPVMSRSVLRRMAAQRGEPAPVFDAPSHPEPRGAQGPDLDAIRRRCDRATVSFVVGSGGVPAFADIEASVRDVPALLDHVAALETKLAEAEADRDASDGAIDICLQREDAILKLLDPDEKRVDEVLEIRGRLFTSRPDSLRRQIDSMRIELDEARAKLARYEADLQHETDALCEAELDLERWKQRGLRLRAVANAARPFRAVGHPNDLNDRERALDAALFDLDEHDRHHGAAAQETAAPEPPKPAAAGESNK